MHALYEIAIIVPNLQENIRLDTRFIDDKILVWKSLKPNKFEVYKSTINKMCKLDWINSPLSEKIVALDLEIWIDRKDKSFKHKSYTKEQNIFLYLSPISAHLPNTLDGMMTSILEKH